MWVAQPCFSGSLHLFSLATQALSCAVVDTRVWVPRAGATYTHRGRTETFAQHFKLCKFSLQFQCSAVICQSRLSPSIPLNTELSCSFSPKLKHYSSPQPHAFVDFCTAHTYCQQDSQKWLSLNHLVHNPWKQICSFSHEKRCAEWCVCVWTRINEYYCLLVIFSSRTSICTFSIRLWISATSFLAFHINFFSYGQSLKERGPYTILESTKACSTLRALEVHSELVLISEAWLQRSLGEEDGEAPQAGLRDSHHLSSFLTS